MGAAAAAMVAADPRDGGRLRGLSPRDLDRARQLLDSATLDPADRTRLEALITGIRADLGRDVSMCPRFGPDWLRPTAPNTWRWDWPHQTLLYKHLNAVRQGTLKRLIIVWPPRHTKTETATVRFPAYWLHCTPDENIILAGHTQPFANKISRKIRRLAAQRFAISPERRGAEEWETVAGGTLRAVGVNVAVAGYGAHLIFIDDPIRKRKDAESQAYRDSMWEWYTDDIYPRQEPGCAIVIVMTRWHEDDLVGRILASEDAASWTVLHLPAIAEENDPLGRRVGEALLPDRFPLATLERIRLIQGSYAFGSLYQGHPSPPEGGIFKRSWWRFWKPEGLNNLPPVRVKLPDGSFQEIEAVVIPPAFGFQGQSWDCAFKDAEGNDFVCGGIWCKVGQPGGGDYYLLDQVKEHLDLPGTLRAIRTMSMKYPKTTAKWVEDKANGPAVIQTLRQEIDGLIAVDPEGGKIARAHSAAPLVESGNVYLPHPALVGTIGKGNWVEELIDSCASFPNATHDDDVDQLTQALLKLRLIDASISRTYQKAVAHA